MIKHIRRCALAAVLALAGSTLAAAPAAATDGKGSDIIDGILDDAGGGQTNTGAGDGSGGGSGSDSGGESPAGGDSVIEELIPEAPLGPVGFVDVPTYETEWLPGEIIPSQVKPLLVDDNVELVTLEAADRSWLTALLVIDGTDAATEYRFERAVPAGHTAVLQPDGSVRFYDARGNEYGGILAPWAIDSTGASVSTAYSIDGDALVQTVSHHGAHYPVVADPSWSDVASTALWIGSVGAAAVTCAGTLGGGCGFAAAVAVASTAVYIDSISSSQTPPTGEGRPSNGCNMRNRHGC